MLDPWPEAWSFSHLNYIGTCTIEMLRTHIHMHALKHKPAKKKKKCETFVDFEFARHQRTLNSCCDEREEVRSLHTITEVPTHSLYCRYVRANTCTQLNSNQFQWSAVDAPHVLVGTVQWSQITHQVDNPATSTYHETRIIAAISRFLQLAGRASTHCTHLPTCGQVALLVLQADRLTRKGNWRVHDIGRRNVTSPAKQTSETFRQNHMHVKHTVSHHSAER